MTRYELLDRIGVGGMAEIFRGKAVAAGGFEKPVAIKRILPHLSQDTRFVELLIAEAKVLSLLKHRNIVQIFDVGLGDDGQYFLVMEYVDGRDLGKIQLALETKRRRIPFDLALHVGAEICEALEHAHSARAPDGKPMSLVHRDVSPSNVLLSRAGEIKLTDFGIAKRAEAEQTGSGAVRGKFAYISPEQARNEHIDPRSDVFSVAILLWEMVTGQRLFSGLGDLEALRAVREAQVRRPTEVDARLSPEIDALLMMALSRDPNRRPTAGEFGEKLRSLRYSLEVTVGDPATELAKIIDSSEQVERQSQQMMAQQLGAGAFDGHEHTEHTVIRIRTADAFSTRAKDDISAARQVIDRFEEEETRLAQLSGDQLRMLRSQDGRDSSELTAMPPGAAGRSRRPTDEPTTARAPLNSEEVATMGGGYDPEATRLVAPTSRRTPPPERIKPRPGTVPPPLPGMPTTRPNPGPNPGPPARVHAPTPLPQEHTPVPGTVHHRHPTAAPYPPPPQMSEPPPQQMPMQQMPMQQMPMQQMPMQQMPMQQMPMQQMPPMNYPVWGGPPHGMHDHTSASAHNPMPNGGGFEPQPRKAALQPWMLVVGALIMAALAFAITRAFIAG